MLQLDSTVMSVLRPKLASWNKPYGWIGPKMAVVLGSGLGALVKEFSEGALVVSFRTLWPFINTEVEGHDRNVVIGMLCGVPTVAFAGRLHLYEGYTAQQVAQMVLLAKELGVTDILLTNAAGCIREDWHRGDLMVIVDHINFTGENPLIGSNNDKLGPRFPGQSHLYQKGREFLLQTPNHYELRKGVYLALKGPNYETPAEIRMLRAMGADAVGMSTVPEAIVANWCGMRVAGVSLLTNMAAGIGAGDLSHNEVTEAGKFAYTRFSQLVRSYVTIVGQQDKT